MKESSEFKEGEVSKALVSSSLFDLDQDQYYNDVVTNIINDIANDQEFYIILQNYIENKF